MNTLIKLLYVKFFTKITIKDIKDVKYGIYKEFWIKTQGTTIQLCIECLFLDAVCPVTHQAMQRN